MDTNSLMFHLIKSPQWVFITYLSGKAKEKKVLANKNKSQQEGGH